MSARATCCTGSPTWAGSWARGRSSARSRWARRCCSTEGAPDHPGPDRLWAHGGAPPASPRSASRRRSIRALIAAATSRLRSHDLSSLRILGSTGEPWNPEPYRWLMRGGRRRPVPDHQPVRRHRGRRVLPLAAARHGAEGVHARRARRSAWTSTCSTRRQAGARGEVGELVCKQPWPGDDPGRLGRPRALPRRVLAAVPRRLGARRLGDDRRGRLLVPARALRRHAQHRGQAARAGRGRERRSRRIPRSRSRRRSACPHEVKGETVWCFVVAEAGHRADRRARAPSSARSWRDRLGKPFAPVEVVFVDELPKTRSAKIVRRAIRALAVDEDPGDLSSLGEPRVRSMRYATHSPDAIT